MPALDPKASAEKLLADFLSKPPAESILFRALSVVSEGTTSTGMKIKGYGFVREAAVKASSGMTRAAVASVKCEDVFVKLEAVLDLVATMKDAERISTGAHAVVGEVAGHLSKPSLLRLLARCGSLFASESASVGTSAVVAVGAALRVAIAKGTLGDAEPTELLSASLASMAKAATGAESRTAAGGVAAAVGALGERALIAHGVVPLLLTAMDSKNKAAPHARESAYLAVGNLCATLACQFEPYSIPMLPKIVGAFTDKDRKVGDAATAAASALLERVSTLSVKASLVALYEGMQVVGGGGRSKIECLRLASLLANRAPRTMGPCLPECIPLVMECLNDSNAKVQAAAEEALPQLVSCVDNAEVASTLKDVLMLALRVPDTTLACIDEVLLTTFCNPMDGTSLAFMVPIMVRGIRSENYELVKKATMCTSNLCALIKESSDIAPFVPLLLPLLDKNLDHSLPAIREATTSARANLLEGAGEEVDAMARHKEIAACVRDGVAKAYAGAPKEVVHYLGETAAAMLEDKLGGVVRVQYFVDAVGELATWLKAILEGVVDVDDEALRAVSSAAIECFKLHLTDAAKAILAASSGKDFCVDIQNIILAFAGRVLLRKADIRFERGHRYGLIGQNGTGKTTLLNRLAAKDINGFPTETRTHYIRHEVLCEEGVDVRTFLKEKAPNGRKDDATVDDVLKQVEFPEGLDKKNVTELAGGWKMKLSVAISILHQPELLLLDEPTNHLDRDAIEWLTKHLLNLQGVTIAVVSHDYDFIDEVCTDVTHYDNGGQLGKPCSFMYYPMTFGQFQKLKPEIAAGLPHADKGVATAEGVLADNKTPTSGMSRVGSQASMAGSDSSKGGMGSRVGSLAEGMSEMSVDDSVSVQSGTISKVEEMIAAGLILPMKFPDPGKPDGIRTFRKPIMTLKDVSFQYPGKDNEGNPNKHILETVSATLTLGSRAVIVGGNGSGKSTFLKILIGDLESEEGVGAAWKHENLRLSYVAQQSLHHLEDFLTLTPIHYIQERFRQGLDAEVAKLKTLAITKEEEEEMKAPGAVHAVVGRQKRGRTLWYEVAKRGRVETDTQFYPLSEIETLFKPYCKKLVKNYDQKAQALESGMAIRPITAAEVLQHLSDFGIDSMLAHGKIRQMSGGQRQRLVICAAFWSKPHVIALDEPTNYLDNDSVAALTKALKDFKGAVVTVSENEAFVAEISNEKWVVENRGVTVVQLRDAKCR